MESETEAMATDEMSCRELVELVTEYLEGTLPAAERARFEEHLAACRHCCVYVEQMRQTIRTLGTLTEDAIPAAARELLLRAFRGWSRADPPPTSANAGHAPSPSIDR